MLKWLQEFMWGTKEKPSIKKNKRFSKLPPYNSQWQIGKTPLSIKFVKEVEETIIYLNKIVDLIKDGKLILTKEWSVEDVYNISKFNDAINKCGVVAPENKKQKIILIPADLDLMGGRFGDEWGVARDLESNEVVGFMLLTSNFIVYGPDELPCEPFEVDVIEFGD